MLLVIQWQTISNKMSPVRLKTVTKNVKKQCWYGIVRKQRHLFSPTSMKTPLSILAISPENFYLTIFVLGLKPEMPKIRPLSFICCPWDSFDAGCIHGNRCNRRRYSCGWWRCFLRRPMYIFFPNFTITHQFSVKRFACGWTRTCRFKPKLGSGTALLTACDIVNAPHCAQSSHSKPAQTHVCWKFLDYLKRIYETEDSHSSTQDIAFRLPSDILQKRILRNF